MRLARRFVPCLLAAVVLGSPGVGFTAEPAAGSPRTEVADEQAKVAQDHLAVAASYDARAESLDALVAEHEQMKRDERRFQVGTKLTARKRRAGMDQHCNAIIRDTRKLQADLREAAAWHRARAAELNQ